MKTIQELEQEIARLQAELVVAKETSSLKTADSYSAEQKCDAFDRLHKQATAHVEFIIRNGRDEKDSDHYLYEAVISETLGRDAWVVINAHLR